ncbi:MAG: Vacuolar protein sorting-associated protein 5 [Vezdaea acicularis]|nr:MAG: Vacuolar protein sorting-associated protein 5 [Vezdaea acicularis]
MDLKDAEESPWGDVPTRTTSNTLPEAPEAKAFEDAESSSKPKPDPQLDASSSERKPSATRASRTPRRVGAQPTRLEAVDDPLGPLGASGDSLDIPAPVAVDRPPAPPLKEQTPIRTNSRPTTSASQNSKDWGFLDSAHLANEAGPGADRLPKSPLLPVGTERQTPRSISLEQAANPKFDITVGDPHKVGDMTSSHIVYQVRTKTTSKAYKQPEFAVTRRYRDFLWLYNTLHSNNPGVVVPPPPEKQAVGRFDTNFVESRRSALERMLNKTAAHPILQHDGDLKLFLESEAFNVDIKNKERKEPGLGESKGMFGSIGGAFSVTTGNKFIEHDDVSLIKVSSWTEAYRAQWFHDKKIYLDALENQLKALLKAVDMVVKQRKELSEAAGDFSASLHALSTVELSQSLSEPLAGLSDLQLRIRELYERQAQQDVLTLGITVDEYIRLIGSIKQAFSQRQKAFHTWHSAEGEMQKRKANQDKLLRQGKTQQDRLNQLNADVADAERKVHQARLTFEDMGRLMRGELERFEREKVEDFKSGVETFLESAVEAQKELIELWETYLMQLDAEENGEPFYKTSAVPATPAAPSQAPKPAAGEEESPEPAKASAESYDTE